MSIGNFMAYVLKDILPAHIKKLNITVAEFERMAGLKRNAVQNILRGTSLHPTYDTLQKIATTLQCDIKDLTDNKLSPTVKHIDMFIKVDNYDLMNEITSYVLQQLKQHQIFPKADEYFKALLEIYQYCVEGESVAFDKRFSDWILSKYFYKNTHKR